MSVTAIAEARQRMKEAEEVLRREAKNAINSAVLALLEAGATSVSWAQKSSEYNDEGMYPGVFGPVLDHPYHTLEDRWEDEKWYDVLYGSESDSKAQALKDILENVGDEILSDIFGDECVVDATLSNGRVVYESEYAGV